MVKNEKDFNIGISFSPLRMGVKKQTKTTADTQSEVEATAYKSFGAETTPEKAITVSELSQQYANLKVGDSVAVKFKSKINDVCQKKGCWMTVDLDEEKTIDGTL